MTMLTPLSDGRLDNLANGVSDITEAVAACGREAKAWRRLADRLPVALGDQRADGAGWVTVGALSLWVTGDEYAALRHISEAR